MERRSRTRPEGEEHAATFIGDRRPAAFISDDTQLAICVARNIDPSGNYLHERFIDELRLWYGYRVRAGRACSDAARRLARGLEDASGCASEGNGAAMRIAPLAIAHAADPAAGSLLADVAQNARLTHDAPLAVAAARLIALLVWHALREPVRTLGRDRLAALLPALSQESGFPAAVLEEALRGGGHLARRPSPPSAWVQHSVPAVLYVLGRADLDFHEAMHLVFSLGGDTDTVGTMVGAILGAQLGLSALPPDLSDGVQHRAVLLALADRLASLVGASNSGVGTVVEIEGDIATRPVEAVVNAWNRHVIPHWLLIPQGVSRAIRRAGGKRTIQAISRRALQAASRAPTLIQARDLLTAAAHLCSGAFPDDITFILARVASHGARTPAPPLCGADRLPR